MKKKLFEIIVSSFFISILLLGCINIYKSHNTVNAAIASNKYITSIAKKTDIQASIQGKGTILAPVSKDINILKIQLPVDQFDIAKIKIGQKACIKFDEIEDKNFEGNVESISKEETIKNNATTYDVIVSINNPVGVKLGMKANINILTEDRKNVLTVPVGALIERDGMKFVMRTGVKASSKGKLENQVKKDGLTNSPSGQDSEYDSMGKLVQVETGLENQNFVEIINGLSEGDKVLITFPQALKSQ